MGLMKLNLVLSGFLLFVVASTFGGKLSPEVYHFLGIYKLYRQGEVSEDLIVKKYSFGKGVKTDTIDLIVEFNDNEGDLSRYVVKRFPGRRKFSIVRMPVDEVTEITNKPFVKYATVSRKVNIFLDKVREKLNLRSIYNYYGQNTVQGKDVVIGIVDSGIDGSFEDFRTPSGGSRILYLLDQTKSVTNPDWIFGAEYTKKDIEKNFLVATDEEGHGTHVAGIAAGSGRLSSGKYFGIAPASDLIVVKTDFSLAGILIGIEYVLNKSRNIGKPCVVNLSLGVNTGSHDGRDIASEILRELINYYGREGNIVVVAGGNAGHYNQHYSNVISPAITTVVINVTNLVSGMNFVVGDFWVSGGANFEVRVITPRGYATSWIRFTDEFTTSVSSPDGEIQISMLSNEYNGDLNVQTRFTKTYTTPLRSGNWKVEFRTLGTSALLHGWLDFSEDTLAHFPNGDNYYTINSLFPIDEVIVTSAYVTKNSFVSPVGEIKLTQLTNDHIAPFSSRGPTRDGRQKPDIAAPGGIIFAPLSSQAEYEQKYLDKDFRKYIGEMGTSMSCAVVSGIAALLLEINPRFTTKDIIDYLKTYSVPSIYDPNGKSWDEAWGWGQVNIKPIIQSLKSPQTLVWFSGNVVRLDNNQNTTTLNFRLTEGNDILTIDIYDLEGNLVKSVGKFNLNSGLTQVNITLDPWMKTGVYLVKITGTRVNTTLKMVVIR